MYHVSLISVLALSFSACAPSFDEALTDIASKTAPAVVPVLIKRPMTDKELKQYGQDSPEERKNCYHFEPIATAFFVHASGILATAGHVAQTDDNSELSIRYEGKFSNVEVVVPTFRILNSTGEVQHAWDLCLLKVLDDAPKTDYPALAFSSEVEFKIGQPMASYGYYDKGSSWAFGNSSISLVSLFVVGRISAAFTMNIDTEVFGSRLVLDITSGPGASGSPVFDPYTGEVVGIITSGKIQHVLAPLLDKEGNVIPGQVDIQRISKGMADVESIYAIREWITKYSTRTDSSQPTSETAR